MIYQSENSTIECAKPGHLYNLLFGRNKLPISFQDGAVKEVGKRNGWQNEELLVILIDRMKFLHVQFPCRENALAITKLEEALMWLEKRTADRKARGVEGLNKQ